MSLTLLIVVGVLSVSLPAAFVLARRSAFACFAASILALGFAAFCAFGFLASFELSDSASWPWQLSYAVLGVASLSTALVGLKGALGRSRLVTSAN